MQAPVIWLSEQDVGGLATINTALDALRSQLPREAAGLACNLPKVLSAWEPRSSLHNLGAMDSERGFGGFKSWVNTPDGAQAIYTLFDTKAGKVLALMDAGTLGALRTSAIAGLATDIMADPAARSMSIIGSGRQALAQVAAVSAVRPLERIHVFSRTEAHKMAFCAQLAERFKAQIVPEERLQDAAQAAPILTLITRANDPYLTAEMLAPGQHVNAVGAILPGFAEMTPQAVQRFDRIVVDNIGNARSGSVELGQQFGQEEAAWARVSSLGQLILQGEAVFRPGDVTCFKAMGMGLSDLAVAIEVYRCAAATGVGQPLTPSHALGLRWQSLPPFDPKA